MNQKLKIEIVLCLPGYIHMEKGYWIIRWLVKDKTSGNECTLLKLMLVYNKKKKTELNWSEIGQIW